MPTFEIPRLMIVAPSSGTGKTMVMAGLVRLLTEKGLKVATFKAGPDYLDPTYHQHASGRTCTNLDLWLMGRDGVHNAFVLGCQDADIALIEGVMGFYDGLSPTSSKGSSWELARVLDCPALLVVDASGMARSLAAMVYGFMEFAKIHRADDRADDDQSKSCLSGIVGVVANRVGSSSHRQLLGQALGQAVPSVRYVGGVLDQKKPVFVERHLGLVSMRHDGERDRALQSARDLVAAGVDLETVLEIARQALPLELEIYKGTHKLERVEKKCLIGIARDKAFDFYYQENLSLLEDYGAELVEFSPLGDTGLPRKQDGTFAFHGIYLGGGYPELFAEKLSQNQGMIQDLREFGRRGGLIYGECGGFMYLCQSLQPDPHHPQEWPMVGLLPGHVVMRERLVALGYVEVETQAPSPLGPAGTRFRGHQFRYSERLLDHREMAPVELVEGVVSNATTIYRVRRRRDQLVIEEGVLSGRVLGSYVHAHWGSNHQIPRDIVESCQLENFAGKHTSLGHVVGKATYPAVAESIGKWQVRQS